MRTAHGLCFLLILTVAQSFAACTSAPVVADADRAWKISEFGEARGDGDWRIRFPASKIIFAAGRLVEGRQVGEWTFSFDDGSQLARGSYDDRGRMQGKWIFWQPDGAICRQRHGMVCDGLALMSFQSDHDHLQSELFPEKTWRTLVELFPMTSGSPHGSGLYTDGMWKRELTDDELRKLDAVHPFGPVLEE